jgi:prepilin-type N-terminal cleavage/methylation domain-containing protein
MNVDIVKQAGSAIARPRQHSQQGFTLIETSIALVIMMIAGLGAASLFVYAMGNNSSARDRELSMAVAQQQMEFLRNAPFASLDAKLTETCYFLSDSERTRCLSTGGKDKTVTSSGRQYTVLTDIAGDSTQNIRPITIHVTPFGTDTSGMKEVQKVFGGVMIETQRATDLLGPNLGL